MALQNWWGEDELNHVGTTSYQRSVNTLSYKTNRKLYSFLFLEESGMSAVCI